MKKEWVYLSGPMSNIPRYNKPLFNRVAKILRGKGYKVINPGELNDYPDGKRLDWYGCLRRDIKLLMKCTTIFVLPNWSRSKGARLEVGIGRRLGMIIKCAPKG